MDTTPHRNRVLHAPNGVSCALAQCVAPLSLLPCGSVWSKSCVVESPPQVCQRCIAVRVEGRLTERRQAERTRGEARRGKSDAHARTRTPLFPSLRPSSRGGSFSLPPPILRHLFVCLCVSLSLLSVAQCHPRSLRVCMGNAAFCGEQVQTTAAAAAAAAERRGEKRREERRGEETMLHWTGGR